MSCTSLEKAEFMLSLEWGGGLHGQGWCSDTGVSSGASSGAGNRPVKIRKDVLIQSNYILAMQGNYNCTRRKVSDKAIITGCLFSGCPCPQNRAESANTVVQYFSLCGQQESKRQVLTEEGTENKNVWCPAVANQPVLCENCWVLAHYRKQQILRL